MQANVSSYWAPRAGNDAAQFEDAFSPHSVGKRSARRLRFAVADGASESMLSGLWADLLVRTWCRGRRRRLEQIVAQATQAWEIELAAYLEERERSDRPVQWFEEPGLDRGAHATLLGIAFASGSGGTGRWSAVAFGDTCLFQMRDGGLLHAFPVESSAAFDQAPMLLPSRGAKAADVAALAVRREGDWQAGDTFLLATDAMAAWFLRNVEAGERPWEVVAALDDGEFGRWLARTREQREVRNDDVTLVRIDVV